MPTDVWESRLDVVGGNPGEESFGTSTRDRKQPLRWVPMALAVTASATSLLIVSHVVLAARHLRPIADDYCRAWNAAQGFWAGNIHWFRTWNGDVTVNASNSFFTGMPLVHLPWTVASAVPFLAAALFALLPVVALLANSVSEGRRRLALTVTLLAPVVLVTWWSFWWLPVRIPPNGTVADVAASVTVWQNINSAYVIPTAAVIAFWIWCGVEPHRQRSWWLLAMLTSGLLTGMAGVQLAVAAIGTVAVLTVLSLALRTARVRVRLLAGLLFILGAAVGAVASYRSPGTRARAEVLGSSHLELSLRQIIGWVLPEAFVDWWQSFAHVGSVVALMAVGLCVALLRISGVNIRPRTPLVVSGSLALFSLALAAVNLIAEEFAYSAYWHLVPSRCVAFVSVVALGIAGGALLGHSRSIRDGALIGAVSTVGLIAAVVMISGAIQMMTTAITERATRWEVGSAPVFSIRDLEAEYAQNCWEYLGNYRETPDRALPE